MGKLKKDGVKNIYCATCEKWMTEYYVSRHIHSKSHFTKKFFMREHLQKKLSTIKRVKKKQSVAVKSSSAKQKKATLPIQPEYQHYKVQSDVNQKTGDVEDWHLRGATSRSSSTPGDPQMQNLIELVSSDYVTDQNCKTPENVEEFQFREDTLKKCRHSHSNILESCSDRENSLSCSPDRRGQVKQRLYESGQELEIENVNEIPQNLLDALGLGYEWDIDDRWTDNVNKANFLIENTELPQEILLTQQCEPQTLTELPIEVVSGRILQSH